jgi:orotate phosphoribosyltransferase
MKAAIIEDVVTTGGSTLKAVEAVRAAGLEVVRIICLVDREEGGSENLKEKGFELEAIYTKTSLLEGAA